MLKDSEAIKYPRLLPTPPSASGEPLTKLHNAGPPHVASWGWDMGLLLGQGSDWQLQTPANPSCLKITIFFFLKWINLLHHSSLVLVFHSLRVLLL